MNLLQNMRKFWYNNHPSPYGIRQGITRKEIQIYGGPDPTFNDCSLCRITEWFSRVRQKDLFIPHDCPTSATCQSLCEKQGNDLWTNLHRNHHFAEGCDRTLDAPCGLIYFYDRLYRIFHSRTCEYHMHNLTAQFAQACQITVTSTFPTDFSDYDFFFLMNTGTEGLLSVTRPSIPTILYCHDMWGDRAFQQVITHLQPDYILTPYPTPWQARYDIPSHTKVWFYPSIAGTFYTRPSLDNKQVDLLVIGMKSLSLYAPRIRYDKQLAELQDDYQIEFSHHVGCVSHTHGGPVTHQYSDGQVVDYMNKWSEYLSTAKYVTFGPCVEPYASEFLLMKYAECLGSGAIPIMPEVADLKRYGVQAMRHYIPLSHVWGRNDVLSYYLDNYEIHRPIAEQAVEWYQANADSLIYDTFEDLIQEVTHYRYPRRLIC